MEEERIYLTPAGLKRIRKHYRVLCRRQQEEQNEKKRSRLSFLFKNSAEDQESKSPTEENLLQNQIQRAEFILRHHQLIVLPQGEERKKINLGVTVVVEIETRLQKFQIVDFPEADPDQGRISRSSPLAKALFGRKVGDEIWVETEPPQKVKIKKIKY